MNILRRLPITVAIGGTIVMAFATAGYFVGVRVNTTKSIPMGLYWASNASPKKGDYVMFCPPQADVFRDAKRRGYIGAGFCPGGYGYMMKKILAAKKDQVSIGDAGVWVNGTLLPNSAPLKADRAGRLLPYCRFDRHTLGENEVLLMSDGSPTSFDARYFGLIDRSQIKSVIRPVLTW